MTALPLRTQAPSRAALAVLLTGTFMASLDTAIVNVAGPAIQSDVGVSGAARGGTPVADVRLLAAPRFGLGMASTTAIMIAYGGFLFTLTLHLQQGLGDSPLRAGLTFAPYAVGFAITSLTVPALAPATGRRLRPWASRCRPWATSGWALRPAAGRGATPRRCRCSCWRAPGSVRVTAR
jgi:MFS family permease